MLHFIGCTSGVQLTVKHLGGWRWTYRCGSLDVAEGFCQPQDEQTGRSSNAAPREVEQSLDSSPRSFLGDRQARLVRVGESDKIPLVTEDSVAMEAIACHCKAHIQMSQTPS